MYKICKWMTDDIIYSTQYYLKYINRAILANLHRRPFKLGRIIVLQEATYGYKKLCSHGNSLFPSPHPLDFDMLVIFSTGSQTLANIFICLLDHLYQAPFANMKIECWGWPEMPLILGRSGTQYAAMVTKISSSFCGAPLVNLTAKHQTYLIQIG